VRNLYHHAHMFSAAFIVQYSNALYITLTLYTSIVFTIFFQGEH